MCVCVGGGGGGGRYELVSGGSRRVLSSECASDSDIVEYIRLGYSSIRHTFRVLLNKNGRGRSKASEGIVCFIETLTHAHVHMSRHVAHWQMSRQCRLTDACT